MYNGNGNELLRKLKIAVKNISGNVWFYLHIFQQLNTIYFIYLNYSMINLRDKTDKTTLRNKLK